MQNATPPALPGYYFDPAKQKYFRIQKNHNASQGSKYSEENIQKEEQAAKRRKLQDKRKSFINRRVKRAVILETPLVGSLLSRELGASLKTLCNTNPASAYTSALKRVDNPIRIYTVTPEPSAPHPIYISHLIQDPVSGAILTGCSSSSGTRALISCVPQHGLQWDRYVNQRIITCLPSPISSISLLEKSRHLITTTHGDKTMATIHLHQLYREEEWNLHWPVIEEPVYTTLRLGPDLSIWCSKSSPFGPSFAVGTSYGCDVFTSSSDAWTRTMHQCYRTKTDHRAIEFLSPNIIIAGLLDGTLTLYDTRTGERRVQRLRHASKVTHLAAIDEMRVVCAGLQNNLDMYDLRYTSTLGKWRSPSFAPQSSRPAISYEGYRNWTSETIGFDIDPELGIVAAATDDGKVQLFELYTGKAVQSPLCRAHFDETVTCLKFTRGKQRAESRPTILLGEEDRVEAWSW
ncbi:MAG: hypothetical protein M1834_001846 [Cirrosporium novae-zelandiae]|nr:MAG: hypothetical protein M1834_001846 [Cirrosporium novae-zelandiae]